jgi:hypothetical protein
MPTLSGLSVNSVGKIAARFVAILPSGAGDFVHSTNYLTP